MKESNATEEVLAELLKIKECLEDNMAEMYGMKIYRNSEGFSQDQLYEIAGRKKYVSTITLRQNSHSFQIYGSQITCVFKYTLKERKTLEKDKSALNDYPYINVEELLNSCEKELSDKLKREGVPTKDIIEVYVLPFGEDCNTFPSKEYRKPATMEIPFQIEGNGKDIKWEYGFLSMLKDKKVGLSPDQEAQYLAFKLILDLDNLTEEEHSIIFNSDGILYNMNVAYHYLLWKEEAHLLTDKEAENLSIIREQRVLERFIATDKELNNMGLSLKKLAEKHPEKARLLWQHIVTFKEKSYNCTGKYPLYMNFDSFLHIYLRHVDELKVENQFADKDKFQLQEKDVFVVIDIVMNQINDEYQQYKMEHPDSKFCRYGDMAYYYSGDYYSVDVALNGCINTFYRCYGKR